MGNSSKSTLEFTDEYGYNHDLPNRRTKIIKNWAYVCIINKKNLKMLLVKPSKSSLIELPSSVIKGNNLEACLERGIFRQTGYKIKIRFNQEPKSLGKRNLYFHDSDEYVVSKYMLNIHYADILSGQCKRYGENGFRVGWGDIARINEERINILFRDFLRK